ncbi:MAG: hypothetical protein LBT09_14375 [Planctomycetaceae bacterium]|nr:hypothetical protein [Planctomycetaceae bacterium]
MIRLSGVNSDINGRNDWSAMQESYSELSSGYNHLRIDVTEVSTIGTNTEYTVNVILNNTYLKFNNTIIVPTISDKHVFLQSHWGAAVTFRDISITGKQLKNL